MAYSDSVSDNAELLRRTVTHLGDFSGRSRRTEVIYYWIAAILIGVTVEFAVSMLVSFEASLVIGDALQLLIAIPTFALFVRRLHDQNRSGWWGLLLPLSILLAIPKFVTEFRGDPNALIAQKVSAASIASGIIGIAILILYLLPGTDGPNDYGPDPRLEEV